MKDTNDEELIKSGKIAATTAALSAFAIAKEHNRDPAEQLEAMTDRAIFKAAKESYDRMRQEVAAVRSEIRNTGEIDT